MKYIHDIKLNGDDEFSKRFNECSELFHTAMDEGKTQKERDEAWEKFLMERYRLEQGY